MIRKEAGTAHRMGEVKWADSGSAGRTSWEGEGDIIFYVREQSGCMGLCSGVALCLRMGDGVAGSWWVRITRQILM